MSMLSQDEIDALVNQLSDPAAAPRPGADRVVKPFDFRINRRIDKFQSNQLQTLRTLHDNFTRLLNNSLSVYLRTRVEASVTAMEQISYGDFVASVGNSSIVSIFSMDPLPGSGVVQIDFNLAFSILDRLLGGPGWYPAKQRDLSDIERTLMQRFTARMLNSYREAWNYLLTLSLKIEALDSNPQFIPRIIPLDQVVAYITCELKIGDVTGALNFALPYSVLQTIGTQLAEYQWSLSYSSGRGMTDTDILQLARNVEKANVKLEVELGRTTVSLRDLVTLAVGDVVTFDKGTEEALVVRVNEREKFMVHPGVYRDKFAVQVAAVIEDEE
jgi:flagellar motor switch protein FliM